MLFRLFLTLPFLAGLASAATLATSSLPDDGFDVVTYNTWKGQSFTLSPEAAAGEITSVTLKLEVITPNFSLAAFIVGSLPGSGVPDLSQAYARLGLETPPSGTGAQPVTFTLETAAATSPVTPGATYWLVLGILEQDFEQDNPSSLVRWHYADRQGENPGAEPGWTVGTRTAESGTAGQNWSASVQTPYLFDMTFTPVPEPASGSLLLPAALVLFRRRRK